MVIGTTGINCLFKVVHYFVSSISVISLNSTIAQAGPSYGICLGQFLYLKHIPFTIPIDRWMSL